MSGLYATDGSINISVVDGSTRVGRYATNGSFNVVQSAGGTFIGADHKSGAMNVTKASAGVTGIRAADGSMNVKATPYNQNCLKVTVVAGALV